ncbi:MAG: bifunctional glutamate N-acetyltransferase/amino-acid acetyltransferase ArgJ [Alphaproteobacteria bacterium]|nr:bifunctional glutamate N-acetyltransferase/amino-acid acetyltransferase ArgJ [Alphaproteobacteria bacterium]
MSTKVSPLAPKTIESLPAIAGVRFATHAAGIRYQGRDDVMVAEFAPGTTAGGVFTRSLTRSESVDRCALHREKGRARMLVVNSGNSNAFTGKKGVAFVDRTVAAAMTVAGCADHEVFMASTGTIGVVPPAEKIEAAIAAAPAKLKGDNINAAARAILTTDTFPKTAVRTATIDGTTVTIAGFCKGAGMIAPDMATMLAYVFTDAALDAAVVQNLVSGGAAVSFNCMTVDGDTSTSDTLMMFATGQANHAAVLHPHETRLNGFRAKVTDLMIDLARQVARDGEGAEKLVEIRVTGAANDRAARAIAMSIANSPLVKTAIAGEDANWGRVVMAVGKAGERADRDKLVIKMGGVTIARDGEAVEGYDETPVVQHMKGREILIETDVGVGDGAAKVWTCDLTHGYIDINGSYRT